ncbi:hypothetical protein SYK_26170 [Pseudodesulfovibrio nedwellii]|uniref:FecR protein domain-containing protein n=1 Tax=Pseudodesulfovibrio nedwellii TaxID=2973072 RepID=A0ABN6S7H0_9BACT|nr:FecR domain-containing protein [Pseudodesulfovibrio nedwellii]BDQ38257.1 hypothetical protein SYK_26170 [Pseudodesulfovibrio nedwellii]
MIGSTFFPHYRMLIKDGIRFFLPLLLTVVFFIVASTISTAQAAEEEPTVGSVKTVTGTANLNRNGQLLIAHVGDHLYKNDILVTADNSSLGVIFRDDTILSLGSRSEVCIDEFIFDPAHDDVSFVTSVSKGTAQFISGQIAKVAPDKMTVETPLSTIGIRGTRFLVKVD